MTPYAAEIAEYTAGVLRARYAYRTEPTTACMGFRRVDGTESPCRGVRSHGVLCQRCHTDRLYAAARMQTRRG